MKRIFQLLVLSIIVFSSAANAQSKSSVLPVRGLCIAAPVPSNLDSFLVFMHNELRPRNINTLILRIDYHYRFSSHPELADTLALSYDDVKKLVKEAKEDRIRLIPQVNLLGHQSWANHTGKLLTAYPEFDETPGIIMPAQYVWPNPDSLYCKSYCPLYPGIHKVIFDIVDEICTAFESSAFHAGMDEVFIIGDSKCPRCAGKSKAELFAGEVREIRNHLVSGKRELWIWGDRLLDGRTTGVGMWEGSFNGTHPAIDMIPKDVVICDWHYERADTTARIFARKGFRVITCPWRKPDIALAQLSDLIKYRKESTAKVRTRYLGIMETVWSPVSAFFDGFYGKQDPVLANQTIEHDAVNTPWNTFKAIFDHNEIEKH